MRSDHSEDPDCMRIALTAMLMVAEYENELIEFPAGEPRTIAGGLRDGVTGDDPAGVDPDAAATVWLLAQAGVPLADVGPYLRSERSVS